MNLANLFDVTSLIQSYSQNQQQPQPQWLHLLLLLLQVEMVSQRVPSERFSAHKPRPRLRRVISWQSARMAKELTVGTWWQLQWWQPSDCPLSGSVGTMDSTSATGWCVTQVAAMMSGGVSLVWWEKTSLSLQKNPVATVTCCVVLSLSKAILEHQTCRFCMSKRKKQTTTKQPEFDFQLADPYHSLGCLKSMTCWISIVTTEQLIKPVGVQRNEQAPEPTVSSFASLWRKLVEAICVRDILTCVIFAMGMYQWGQLYSTFYLSVVKAITWVNQDQVDHK